MSEKFVVYSDNFQSNYYICEENNYHQEQLKPQHPRAVLSDQKNRNFKTVQSLSTGRKTQIHYYRKTEEIRKRLVTEYAENEKENVAVRPSQNEEIVKNIQEVFYKRDSTTKSTQHQTEEPVNKVTRPCLQLLKDEPISLKKQDDKKLGVIQKETRPQKIVQTKSVSTNTTQNERISSVFKHKSPVRKSILKSVSKEYGNYQKQTPEKKISFKDPFTNDAEKAKKRDTNEKNKEGEHEEVINVDMKRVTVRRQLNYDYDSDEEIWTDRTDNDVTWVEDENEKIKLLNRRKIIRTRTDYSMYEGYTIDSLSIPFLEDIIAYLRRLEYKYVLRRSLFINQPHNGNPRVRIRSINMMLRIVDFKKLPLLIFLKAVILFDNILHVKQVSPTKHMLVGLVCLWISIKNACGSMRKASELAELSKNIYTTKEILEMEMAIFSHFKGDFNFPDPTDFVAYLIHSWLQIDYPIFNCLIDYILICFAMHSGSTTVAPSLQAAAVVHLSSQFFSSSKNAKPWTSLMRSACYYGEIEIKNIEIVMMTQVKKFTNPYSECYPFTMYSTADKFNISNILFKKLEKQ